MTNEEIHTAIVFFVLVILAIGAEVWRIANVHHD
jgi:hypothetical protein